MAARTLPSLVRSLAIAILLLSLAGLLRAQDAVPLSVGQNRLGAFAPEQMQQTFLLDANVGEVVVIRVLGITPGLAPEFRLASPTGVEVLADDNPAQSPTVEGRAVLLEDGLYTIKIASASGLPGQFMLSLQPGAPPPAAVPLLPGEPVHAEVDANTPLRAYTLSLTSSQPVLLFVQSAAGDSSVSVHLQNLVTQRTIARSEGPVTGLVYVLDGVTAQIQIDVEATAAARSAFVLCAARVGVDTCASVMAESGWLTAAGAETQSTVPAAESLLVCSALSNTGGAVNVRSGPSTAYTIVAGLSGDQRLEVTGQLSGGGWYRINLNGQEAWIGASVTRLEGPCDALTAVNVGPGAQLAPTLPPTAPPVPTSAPTTAPDTLVVTLPPSPTATATATATETQPTGTANLRVIYTGVRSTELQSINRLVAGVRNDGTATSRPFTVVICPADRLECQSAAMEPLAPGMTAEASTYFTVSSQYGVIQATIVEQ